jgi:hypothetical protein
MPRSAMSSPWHPKKAATHRWLHDSRLASWLLHQSHNPHRALPVAGSRDLGSDRAALQEAIKHIYVSYVVAIKRCSILMSTLVAGLVFRCVRGPGGGRLQLCRQR